jgi:hypothetical protein
MLCGLDGEYMQGGYHGPVTESFAEFWKPVLEAYGWIGHSSDLI